MQKSSLSVIMLNYNHSYYIAKALESILAQSYRPMEVIILDDASTDNSLEIIQQFVKRDPIVHLIRNKKNIGAALNTHKAFQLAKGDYICFIDDYALAGFFEKSMQLLAQYPQAGLCYSDLASLDSCTGIFKENRLHWSKVPRYFSPKELVKVMQGGYIATHTSIIKRSALLEIGGFIPQLRWHTDWFALLVIGFRYGICYIPEPLAAIRVSPDSYSAAGRRRWELQKEVLLYLLYLLKSPAYRDVLPYFIRADSLHHFNGEIVRVVISNPAHWDFLSFRLIRRQLWNEIRKILSFILPARVKRLYRRDC